MLNGFQIRLTEHNYKIPSFMPFVLRKILVVFNRDLLSWSFWLWLSNRERTHPTPQLWFCGSVIQAQAGKENLPLTQSLIWGVTITEYTAFTFQWWFAFSPYLEYSKPLFGNKPINYGWVNICILSSASQITNLGFNLPGISFLSL